MTNSTSNSYTTNQWLRRWGLVVYNQGGGNALVLSMNSTQPNETTDQLRMAFEVRATDNGGVPNTAVIRVYNPEPGTAQKIMQQYSRVTLQAGYLTGNYGVIFDGWIKMTKYGKTTPVESFVEIYAADGDLAINNAVLITGLHPPGNTAQDQWSQAAQSMQPYGVDPGDTASQFSGGPAQPRGSVKVGMSADVMNEIAKTNKKVWFVEQGKLVVVNANGARPGQGVVLNGNTGLIGFPTQTSDGIEIRALLNPTIYVRQMLQINNASINQASAGQGGFPGGATFPLPNQQVLLAPINADGSYIALVVEHRGDTRGNDWYTEIVAWSADPHTGQLAAPDGTFPTSAQIGDQDTAPSSQTNYATGLSAPGSLPGGQ